MKIIRIALACTVIGVWCCAGRLQAQQEGHTVAAVGQDPAPLDTLRLVHPSIVFCVPSGRERDSLMGASVFAFDSLSVRFTEGRDRLSPFLRKKGIDPITSHAQCFFSPSAETPFYVRAEFVDVFGIIYFRPGKEPLVVMGVPAESDMFTTMMKYFDITR